MKRGVLTVEALKERCKVNPVTHCWDWQGAMSENQPRVWTLDYERICKRVMSGPLAAWHIAYQAPPRAGCLVFRGCMNAKCLNPAHLREAANKTEIGLHIRRLGSRIGTALESRRANIAKAHVANGMNVTPREKVLAVRAADPALNNTQVGAMLGLSHQVVGAIRTGKRHAGVTA